jgi:hypothetical protein
MSTIKETINRAKRAFQPANRIVAVKPDNQNVAHLSGIFQIVYMARMQQIETAIGKDHPYIPFMPVFS